MGIIKSFFNFMAERAENDALRIPINKAWTPLNESHEKIKSIGYQVDSLNCSIKESQRRIEAKGNSRLSFLDLCSLANAASTSTKISQLKKEAFDTFKNALKEPNLINLANNHPRAFAKDDGGNIMHNKLLNLHHDTVEATSNAYAVDMLKLAIYDKMLRMHYEWVVTYSNEDVIEFDAMRCPPELKMDFLNTLEQNPEFINRIIKSNSTKTSILHDLALRASNVPPATVKSVIQQTHLWHTGSDKYGEKSKILDSLEQKQANQSSPPDSDHTL